MNNCIKIIFVIIFVSSCSILEKKKYYSPSLQTIYLNHNILNKNYVGMTREQVIYIFGMPIISDSFNDVYHYNLCDILKHKILGKELLSFYFKDNKVSKFDIK